MDWSRGAGLGRQSSGAAGANTSRPPAVIAREEVSHGPPTTPVGDPGRRRPAPGRHRHHGPRRHHRHRNRLSLPTLQARPKGSPPFGRCATLPGLDPTPGPDQDHRPGSGQRGWRVVGVQNPSAVTASMVLLDPSVRTPPQQAGHLPPWRRPDGSNRGMGSDTAVQPTIQGTPTTLGTVMGLLKALFRRRSGSARKTSSQHGIGPIGLPPQSS
jgi:hypothetical protein